MGKVAVFHPGVQHSWQTALALQQLGALEWFATSILYQPDRWPYLLERIPGPIGRKLHAEFRRFAPPPLDPKLVRTHGLFEWAERVAGRAGLTKLEKQLDRIGNERFVHALAKDIASDRPFALWGYNNSSRSSFALAKAHGRTRILDRTIGDFRGFNRDMAALQDRYGQWFAQGQAAVDAETIAREAEEHALADHILVGCEFAAQTVREFAETPDIAAKVRVLEYCYDERLFGNLPPPTPAPKGGPVRFLFLGLAIPRKGIQHVLEAIAQLPASEASLTIVGKMGIPPELFAKYRDRITYHPTVPRAEVPGIMAAHDVLLFPTYFEGAGIVLYEALAAGMGLIQSDKAALAVTEDTGILLPAVGTEPLVAAMRAAISDRERLWHWRGHAQAEARQYTFAGYRDRIGALIGTI